MIDTKHTKGPWAYELRIPQGSADGEWIVYDPQSDNGDVLAIIDPDCTREDLGESAEANAALFAAAPDLLAALVAIVFQASQGKVLDRDACISQARAAIAKAKP